MPDFRPTDAAHDVLRAQRLTRLIAEIRADNFPMQAVARQQGFDLRMVTDDPRVVKAEMRL
jgi:hypothetical protein